MPTARTLVPLLALGLTASSCRRDEASSEPIDAELTGARLLDPDGTPRFDARNPPLLIIGGPALRRPQVSFDGRPVAHEALLRGGRQLIRVTPPEVDDTGSLCVQSADRRRCWTARFAPRPRTRPAIAVLDQQTPAAIEAALAGLVGEDRIWGHQALGRALRRAGRSSEAANVWVRAADAALALDHPSEAARSLRAAAFMAYDAADFGRAEQLLGRSLQVLGTSATEADHLGHDYYSAVIAHALSRFQTATALAQQVAERAWAIGEDELFGYAIETLALILVDQGRVAEATRAIGDARLARLAADRGPSEQAAYLNNRAWIGLLDLRSSTADATRSGQAYADLHAAERMVANARELRGIRSSIAWLGLLTSDLDAAAEAIAKVSPDANDPDAELIRGEIGLRQGDLAAAGAAFTRAAQILERTGAGLPTDNSWRAAYGIGRIAAARGDRGEALIRFRDALSALDTVAAQAGVWHARARFYADRRPLVDDTVQLLLDHGDFAAAFAVIDAANGRALRALEGRTRLDRLPEAVRAEWEQHRGRFAAARQAWDAARDAGDLLGEADKAAWQAAQETRQREMVTAFEAAEALLTREAPTRTGAADAEAIARALPPGAALVAYGRVGDRVHGFWLTAGRPIEHRVIAGDGPDATALLTPFTGALDGVEHLYVVPGDVPAARGLATVERGGAPLGTRISLSDLAYAGLVLRPEGTPRQPPLVVADPTVDLPHAYAEGRSVAAGIAGARLIARGDATREAVREAMGGARAMHYAGHGVARADSPWQAHLALAGETTLTVADILTADVPTGTVVLSGCRTGVRGALSDREALGLADAFVAAGSRAVLATRRDIPDEAAARFITRFHAEGGLEHPGAALQTATAAFYRAGDPIWSAFRLTGHP